MPSEPAVQPGLQFAVLALQRGDVEDLAQNGDGDRAGAEIDAPRLARGATRIVDAELRVELLQPVLHAAERKIAAPRDRIVGEAESDIDENLVFALGQSAGGVL